MQLLTASRILIRYTLKIAQRFHRACHQDSGRLSQITKKCRHNVQGHVPSTSVLVSQITQYSRTYPFNRCQIPIQLLPLTVQLALVNSLLEHGFVNTTPNQVTHTLSCTKHYLLFFGTQEPGSRMKRSQKHCNAQAPVRLPELLKTVLRYQRNHGNLVH